ncbi:MAG: pilus assembly protein [Rhodobacteraceae bacterium]|nr:pilus assembly protein [Paracoccaceae bacterium]
MIVFNEWSPSALSRAGGRYLSRGLRRLARDDAGSMVIFGVYLFVMMLMVAGIGVDLMRAERDRAKLQYTLDRAVLAAADMDQPLAPAAVVEDYFAKAGMSEYLSSVDALGDLTFRRVTGRASSSLDTQFAHMTGLSTMNVAAASVAEESIDGVEITLVLDVSGSMGSNNRMTNLRVAAKDFIDEMYDNSLPEKVSITIVPYATQVSLPEEFASQLNLTGEHNYSRCVNFGSNDFNNTEVSLVDEVERTMHFDPWSWFDGRLGGGTPQLVSNPVCSADASREAMIMQNDRQTLKNFIDGLQPTGNTSIDLGMKWAAAFLDPSTRPAIAAMAAQGAVPADFADRPAAYDSASTIKVVVLMTDGQNTSQYFIQQNRREGLTDVWWDNDNDRYAIFDNSRNAYFIPETDSWIDSLAGEITLLPAPPDADRDCTRAIRKLQRQLDRANPKQSNIDNAVDRVERDCGAGVVQIEANATQLTYAELWAFSSLAANTENNFVPWMPSSNQAWNQWYNGVFSSVNGNTKDSRTQRICNAVKNQQTVVFAIGFEAPESGRSVLRDCASSPSHYFDASGLEIADAFSAIASSIRALRLTQ